MATIQPVATAPEDVDQRVLEQAKPVLSVGCALLADDPLPMAPILGKCHG